MPWRRERLPTPVFWPGEFHGLHSPWGLKESDTTEQLSPHLASHGCQSIAASASAIGPSNEYSGLIFFRINWFDLLAVQGTLESLLQHHDLKASILWQSVFSTIQLSHPYMTMKNHSFDYMDLCWQSGVSAF